MSLAILVAKDQWQDFDKAWQDMIASGEGIDDLLNALKVVGQKRRLPRCLPMLKEHVGKLRGDERHEDAARLLGAALKGGAAGSDLSAALVEAAEAAWGSQPYWERFVELSGLGVGAGDIRSSWKSFERLCAFQTGSLVYHPGGWGTGEILSVDDDEGMMKVRFASGREDTFPLSAAIDIFDPLDETDLRAQFMRDADGLKKKLKKEPLEALKNVLVRHAGRATVVSIKNALMQVGVEGSSWSSWWRNARKQASTSPWFRVSGTAQKGEVQLLMTANDPTEELKKNLELVPTLKELNTRVRDLLIGSQDENLRNVATDVLAQAVELPSHPEVDRMLAWITLRDHTGETPLQMTEAVGGLLTALRPADGEPGSKRLWELIGELPTAKDQEKVLLVVKEAVGTGGPYLDLLEENLEHVPVGTIRIVIDELKKASRFDMLRRAYAELLTHPLRSPHALVGLAKILEADIDPHDATLPTPPQRAQAFLSLASFIGMNRKGSKDLGKVHIRLNDLLTKGGETALLRRLLEGANFEALQSCVRLVQRGVDESIDNIVGEIAHNASAEEGGLEQFWVDDQVIWTTREGLEGRRKELVELIDVKIPANTDAIGRAAAMGDLSENAEWEAAIEEQRNLTARAAEIEDELRRADVIDEIPMPEHVVCPGARVRYREVESGTENQIDILGPWDGYRGDKVVSYRAPLAAGLLGLSVGEMGTLQLPTGPMKVEVLDVDLVHL